MKNPLFKFAAWFFEKGDARGAAALRIAYGLIYLYMLWDLYPTMDLVMGHSGVYGSLNPEAFNLNHPFNLLYRFDSPAELRVWFWLSVLFAFMTVFGLLTRLSVLLTFFSVMLFQVRGPYLIYGTDQVLALCFFWLLFLACGKRWSLDRLLIGKRRKASTEIELWPVKAIQIQIALIYLLTGFIKFRTEEWLNGSAVYYALHLRGFVWSGVEHLTTIQPLMVMMTYYSLLAEMSFPFLVFWKRTRFLALGAVFFMHLGIDLLMQIRFFSLSMYAGYLAFIQPAEWEWLARKVSGFLRLTDGTNRSRDENCGL
jgi:hypothetical protein